MKSHRQLLQIRAMPGYSQAPRSKVIWMNPSMPLGLSGRAVGAAGQVGEPGRVFTKLDPPPPSPETHPVLLTPRLPPPV
jgi:hypothetical protein